jgi:hypothetical protein
MDARKASEAIWNVSSPTPTIEQINMGSLQRIADAVETMSGSYNSIISDRDLYKRWYQEEQKRANSAERHNAALRGVITRMKRKQNAEQ